jgi:hypothetical protein
MLLNGGEGSDLDEGIKTFTVRSGSGKGRPGIRMNPVFTPRRAPILEALIETSVAT